MSPHSRLTPAQCRLRKSPLESSSLPRPPGALRRPIRCPRIVYRLNIIKSSDAALEGRRAVPLTQTSAVAESQEQDQALSADGSTEAASRLFEPRPPSAFTGLEPRWFSTLTTSAKTDGVGRIRDDSAYPQHRGRQYDENPGCGERIAPQPGRRGRQNLTRRPAVGATFWNAWKPFARP